MKGRIWRFLLALAVCATLCPAAIRGVAANTVQSGTCGDNLTWTLDDAGTLTVRGAGPMGDEAMYGEQWAAYRDSIRKVEIEDGVTSIECCAFIRCANLTDVRIPDSVTKIRVGAFAYCSSLESVTIPSGVTEFGFQLEDDYQNIFSTNDPESPFSGCARLSAIRVSPANPAFTELDGAMFRKDMTVLVSYPPARSGPYRIPDGVTRIGVGAFASCKGLTGVVMPDSVTSVGTAAFWFCETLTNVKVSKNLTEISSSGFRGCKALKHFVFPGTFVRLGGYAFDGCDAMERVVFSEGVTSLPGNLHSLYHGDMTKTIVIPASMTRIASSAFSHDIAYDIYYEGTEEQWNAIEYFDYTWYKGSPFENSVIHYNSPMPNTDTHAGEIVASKTAAAVTAYAAEPATAYFTAYAPSGRFLGVQTRALTPGTESALSFSVADGAANVKLFLLGDDDAVLCPVAASGVS